MRQDLMDGRGPKTIRVPKAYRKVLDLTHNECDPALAASETKASDITVGIRALLSVVTRLCRMLWSLMPLVLDHTHYE